MVKTMFLGGRFGYPMVYRNIYMGYPYGMGMYGMGGMGMGMGYGGYGMMGGMYG